MLLLSAHLAVLGCGPAVHDASDLEALAEQAHEQSEGEGESEETEDVGCVIGDAHADAALTLVFRDAAGETRPHVEGGEVPLVLPLQGGKVVYVGVEGVNVSCQLQISAGLYDDCNDPPVVFAMEGRPITLEEGPDGRARPINSPDDFYVANFANLPMCPSFGNSRDTDGSTVRLEVRVTEALRPGEAAPREHVLTGSLTPTCADADCTCECDAGFVTELTREEQCGTIDDDDLLPGQCPL